MKLKHLAALILLIPTLATAETKTVLCHPDSQINIRKKASVYSSVEGHLYCGDTIEVDNSTKKKGKMWYHFTDITFENGGGWVAEDYLVDGEVQIVSLSAFVKSNGRVAVRKSPDGERVKWISAGQDVTVYAYSDEWASTNLGYIKLEYLQIIKE